MDKKTRLLVADDSAFARRLITDSIAAHPEFEIVGYAATGKEALEMTRNLNPDVITMDIQMPEMDGYQATKEIMAQMPRPVLILSTATEKGSHAVIQALEAGAVECIGKPHDASDLRLWQEELLLKLKVAMAAKHPGRRTVISGTSRTASSSLKGKNLAVGRRLVVIGSSTGGPKALQEIIPKLPKDLPAAVVVVQHMPAGFTRSMSERLAAVSQLRVKEAEQGEKLEPGKVLVAPGDYHLKINSREEVVLNQDPPIGTLRPAVDVTFMSAAEMYGDRTLAVILTGMGSDGTKGAGAIKNAGGRVLAEDEASCVVYGMPRSVVEQGYADAVLPLGDFPAAIVELIKEGR